MFELKLKNLHAFFCLERSFVFNVFSVSVWGSTFGNEAFLCTDCGDNAAIWVSNFLLGKNEGLRLGYGDGSQFRNVLRDHKKWAEHYTNMDNQMTVDI